MKYFISLAISIISLSSARGQTAAELITMVKASQAKLYSGNYKVHRIDTFVTGQTRMSTGEAKIKTFPANTILGFAFWARKDGINRETIYDGKTVFEIDHEQKEYESSSDRFKIEHSLGSPGGQMVVTDFARLDTAHVVGFTLTQDTKNYYLQLRLPDISEYNVEKRTKTVTIDKQLLLPVGIRSRQETLGKVQDINYILKDIKINDPSTSYDFSTERVPSAYARKQYEPNKALLSLVGKQMPAFVLPGFNNDEVNSNSFRNKVVLLDFWEVWCGPCLVSMPKVQELYKKYSSKGLGVYGMISEKDQLDVAKLMVSKRKIYFPMLQSNEELNKTFGILAVPTYILVDRNGTIRFTYEGFSDEIEKEIQKLL